MGYLLALFQWGSAVVRAVCLEVSVWVVNLALWMELLKIWGAENRDVTQIEPLLCVPWDNFPGPEGPSKAERSFGSQGCTDCNFAIHKSSLTLKNQPCAWHEMWIPPLYQLVQCKAQDCSNCEGGSSSGSFIRFFQMCRWGNCRLCDLELNTTTLFTASAQTLSGPHEKKHYHLLELSGLRAVILSSPASQILFCFPWPQPAQLPRD